jgi:hypothetical protein
MRASMNIVDPWKRMVRQLMVVCHTNINVCASPQSGGFKHNFAEPLTRDRGRRRSALSSDARPFPQAVVRVIERPTRSTAIVYWSDARTCHYGHQGWRARIAIADGACSLTGARIHRGDSVYQPSQCRPKPLNATAMILATSMSVQEGDELCD